MKALISFSELEEIIKDSTDQIVHLSYGDKSDTIAVEYTVSVKVPLLGTKSKAIRTFLTINNVSDMDVEITYAWPGGWIIC